MSLITSFLNFVLSLRTFLFYTWPFLLLIILFVLRKRWNKFPLEAIIIEKRGDNLIKTNDRIGLMNDKKADMTYYKFHKSKDTIPVYNYDWILHNRAVPNTFLERFINLLRGNVGTIFLFRYGSKQYKPVNINVNGLGKNSQKLVPVKNKKGETVYVYRYEQFDPRGILGVLDFDVVDWDNINFMVQEQRASVVRRQKKGEFWKQTLIPIVIIAAALLMGIFILKFSFDASRGMGGTVQENGGGSKIMGAITDTFTPGE